VCVCAYLHNRTEPGHLYLQSFTGNSDACFGSKSTGAYSLEDPGMCMVEFKDSDHLNCQELAFVALNAEKLKQIP
jgi:hypothetical protein